MKYPVSLFLAAALAGAAATGALAAGPRNAPGVDKLSAGAPNLYGPYAQAQAIIGQAGAVIEAKGFSAVTNPAVGIVCLELQAGIQLKTAPVVSVEWGRSLGVALFAQSLDSPFSCPSPTPRTIEVRTYKGDTGGVGSSLQIPVLSNQVAFNILVP